VHGLAGDASVFDPLCQELEGSVRLIRYDQRGHDRSGWVGPRSATVRQLGRDLGRVLDQRAGTGPVVLAGHSLGGMVVLGGQVALPGTPRWGYLAVTSEERIVADGWAPEDYGADGNRMFVTCGIGFSLAPIWVNAPPQVVFFELRPGD
jgi:pimeloyl-ACP methyl ester carboxylesterase